MEASTSNFGMKARSRQEEHVDRYQHRVKYKFSLHSHVVSLLQPVNDLAGYLSNYYIVFSLKPET